MARGSPNVRRQFTQPLGLPAPIASLVDAFPGAALDTTKWTAFGSGITVSGAALNMLATTSYPSVVSRASYRLKGSSIYLLVTPLPTGGGSFQTGMSLQVASGGSNAQGAIGVNINGSPRIVQPFYRDNTGTEHDFGSITLPANPCWLRIRESAGTTFWDWAADGTTWTNFASMANPAEVDALYVQLWAGHYAAETDTTASFANVNNVPVTAPVALTPVAQATAAASAVVTAPVVTTPVALTPAAAAVSAASALVRAAAMLAPTATAVASASCAPTAPALLTSSATAVMAGQATVTANALLTAAATATASTVVTAITFPPALAPTATAVAQASASVFTPVARLGTTSVYIAPLASGPPLTQSVTVPAAGIPIGATAVLVGYYGGVSPLFTVTDSKGNTWTRRKGGDVTTAGIVLWDSQITVALVSGDLINCVFSSNPGVGGFTVAWYTKCYFDKFTLNTFTGTAADGGSLTTLAGGGPVIGMFYVLNNSNTTQPSLTAAGSGYTNETGASVADGLGGRAHGIDWVSKIGPGSATEDATGTFNVTGTTLAGATISYSLTQSTQVAITPAATGSSGASALVTAPAVITASASAVAQATALVSAPTIPFLTPVATALSASAVALAAAPSLIATSTAVSASAAASTAAPALIATSTAVSASAAGLVAAPSLIATSTAVSAAAAALVAAPSLIATSTAVSAGAAVLVAAPSLVAASTAVSASAATLISAPALVATSTAVTAITASFLTAPALLTGVAPDAPGLLSGPTFVQGASLPSTGGSNSANPYNLAFASNVTAGNLMVVAIGGDDSTQVHGGATPGDHTSWTVTDSLGSTWTKRGQGYWGTGTYYTQVWDAIVPAGGGANTIHWNSGQAAGAQFARILIHEISGVNVLDNANVVVDTTPNNSAVGSITTAQAVEYIFAWLVHNAGLTGITSPFTALEVSSVEYTAGLVTSATGTYHPTAPASGNDHWSVISAGYYSGVPALAVSAIAVANATATVTASAVPMLTPAATAVASATVLVAAPARIAASATAVALASALVTTTAPVVASATAVSQAQTLVTAPAKIAASATAVAGSTLALTAAALLTPAATGVSAAVGLVTAPAFLTGSAIAVGAAAATVVALVTATNSAEGGSNGATVTIGNSGGVSGTPFDVVDIGAGATVIYDNTHVMHGAMAYQFATTGTASLARVQWNNAMGSPQSKVWFRAYVYLTALPAATIRLVNADQGSTACAVVVCLTTGKLQVRTGSAGTQTLNTTTTVPTNQWFRIEGYCVGDPAVGQVELKLFLTPDSVTPTETQTSAANVNTFGAMNHFNFGVSTTQASVAPFWEDDVGFTNVGYLGPAAAQPLLTPSATAVAQVTAAVSAPALLTASATAVTGASSQVSAATSFTASATAVSAATGVVSTTGSTSGSATAIASAVVALTAGGIALAPTATAVAAATGQLTAITRFVASATAVAQTTALVSAAVKMTAAATAISSSALALAAPAQLIASGAAVSSASASATAAAQLGASATVIAAASCSVTTATVPMLTPSASAIASTQALVTAIAPLQASAQAVSQATAQLAAPALLTASGTAVASASVAQVFTTPRLTPAAQAVSAAALTVVVPGVVFLTPSASAIAATSCGLTAPALLTVSAQAITGAAALVTIPRPLTVSATAVAAAAGALTAAAQLAPVATALAQAQAALFVAPHLTASASATASAAGLVTAAVRFTASVQSLAAASAQLSASAQLTLAASAVSSATTRLLPTFTASATARVSTTLTTLVVGQQLTPSAQVISRAHATVTGTPHLVNLTGRVSTSLRLSVRESVSTNLSVSCSVSPALRVSESAAPEVAVETAVVAR